MNLEYLKEIWAIQSESYKTYMINIGNILLLLINFIKAGMVLTQAK